jgi:hypothetical protein
MTNEIFNVSHPINLDLPVSLFYELGIIVFIVIYDVPVISILTNQ